MNVLRDGMKRTGIVRRQRPQPGRCRLLWGALMALLVSGCATQLPHPAYVSTHTAECRDWWPLLDKVTREAGVADAQARPIPGFPGLRSSRLISSLRPVAGRSEAEFEAWMRLAAEEDASAREAEIANLPVAALTQLGMAGVPAALARTEACRNEGMKSLLSNKALREPLLAEAVAPAHYSTTMRALGLYPLVRWPFFEGVQRWQNGHMADMKAWREATPSLTFWRPPAAPDPGLPPLRRDALGLPQWTEAQGRAWLAWHAPQIAIETRGDFDRFGSPTWLTATGRAAAAPTVKVAKPVVYQRLSSTRLGDRWLPQLVYSLWFPERPSTGALDLLAGELDGLVLRLTLDEQGQPLLLDTMHACGCYHMFFASSRLRPKPTEAQNEEWLFAPAALPATTGGETLLIQLSSGSHHIMSVSASPRSRFDGNPSGAAIYALDHENRLRSLEVGPAASSVQRRSLYGPDGLVPGTQRGERWLFWPMGIQSAGAMRQWGHHATAFVGRRHFDDPDLLDQRYEMLP